MSSLNLSLKQEKLLLWLLAAVQFTNLLDYVIMMPLGPQFLRVFQITPAQFGTLVSVYAIAAGIAGVLAAAYLDRFDRRTAMLWLYAGFGVSTLLCALAPNYAMLLAARTVTGAFGGVSGALIIAVVSDIVPEERRGAGIGLIMSAFAVASVIGVPIGLVLANRFGWHAPFFLLAVLSFILLVVIARQFPPLREHLQAPGHNSHWRDLGAVLTNANHIRAFLFMGLLCFAAFTVIPFISPYMVKNVGFAETHLPLLYLSGGLCTMFTTRWVGHLSDKLGRLRVFQWFAVIAATVTFLLTHLGHLPEAVAILVTTLFMIGMTGRMVPAMAILTASVEPRRRGAFMSLNASVQHLSSGLAAFVSGLILHETAGQLEHYDVVGWISAVLLLCCLPLAAGIKRVSAPLPVEIDPLVTDAAS